MKICPLHWHIPGPREDPNDLGFVYCAEERCVWGEAPLYSQVGGMHETTAEVGTRLSPKFQVLCYSIYDGPRVAPRGN